MASDLEVHSEVRSSIHTLSTVQSAPLFDVICLATIQSIVLSIGIFGGPGALGEVSEEFLVGVMQVQCFSQREGKMKNYSFLAITL